jgi:holdfast attachment protein HfaA
MTCSNRALSTAAIALSLLGLTTTMVKAGDWTNSATYNGAGAGAQNQASNYSMRDANGNLTLVNGQVAPSIFQQGSGAQYAGGGVGAGTSTYGQANAIGNQLSVVVVGNHNTTIIDSSQINNGNQTATTELNAH